MRFLKKYFFIFYLILLTSSLISQNNPLPPEHFTRERTYDVQHIRLEIKLDEINKKLNGKVTTTIVPLRLNFRSFELDAAEMKIKRVYLQNGRELEFQYDSLESKLKIYLDKNYSMTDTISFSVEYSVSNPRKGLYFIYPDSGYPDKPYQIWSQGEPEDNHYWFPCYDYPNDRATSEVIATVNKNFIAISNGKLVSVSENKETKTYHWRMDKPHVSYLISIVAGEYVRIRDWYKDIPVDYYVYKSNMENARLSFDKTVDMIKFFSEKIGYEYPYSKYAQTIVEDFIFGGMENVTATTLTSRTIHDERAHLDVSSDGLVAHELAHQWWGNLLTCRSWEHIWLNEGFATYFAALYTEHDKGWDEFEYKIYNMQSSARFADMVEKRPTVWNRYFDPIDLFDGHVYARGGAILHMIRFILGDELFWKAINHYAHKHAFGNVETNDFKIAIEEATGYNLHWFFDQWLYKAGYPIFEVSYRYDNIKKKVILSVKQIQNSDSLSPKFYRTPVDVEITTDGESKIYRIFIDEKEQEFEFPADKKPLMVIFDKGNWILKEMYFEKSKDELIYQARNSDDVVARIRAVKDLGNFINDPEVMDVLKKIASGDKFYAVRIEAINSLSRNKSEEIADFFMKIFKREKKSSVRRALVNALGSYTGDGKIIKFLKKIIKDEKSYYVIASAFNSLIRIDSVKAMDVIKEALNMDSHNNVIRTTVLRRLGDFKNTNLESEAIKILKEYSAYGKPVEIRMAAIPVLGNFADKDESVIKYILSMADDRHLFVRMTVYNTLGRIGRDEQVLKYLEMAMERELDGRVLKSIRRAIDNLRRKLEGSDSKPK